MRRGWAWGRVLRSPSPTPPPSPIRHFQRLCCGALLLAHAEQLAKGGSLATAVQGTSAAKLHLPRFSSRAERVCTPLRAPCAKRAARKPAARRTSGPPPRLKDAALGFHNGTTKSAGQGLNPVRARGRTAPPAAHPWAILSAGVRWCLAPALFVAPLFHCVVWLAALGAAITANHPPPGSAAAGNSKGRASRGPCLCPTVTT